MDELTSELSDAEAKAVQATFERKRYEQPGMDRHHHLGNRSHRLRPAVGRTGARRGGDGCATAGRDLPHQRRPADLPDRRHGPDRFHGLDPGTANPTKKLCLMYAIVRMT